MVMLTLSRSMHSLRPPHCTTKPCIPASNSQTSFLYCALFLIALGTGGIKPCVSSFGSDQFDEYDHKEAQKKIRVFNWFSFAINMGALFGIILLVYMQVKLGWSWGFGIPTVAMISSIFMLGAGYVKYRYQKPMGSVFTRFIQVIVASLRNLANGVDVAKGGACLYRRKGSTTAWVIITSAVWVIIMIHLQGTIAALYRGNDDESSCCNEESKI